jgi:hypothetical protein
MASYSMSLSLKSSRRLPALLFANDLDRTGGDRHPSGAEPPTRYFRPQPYVLLGRQSR